MQRKIIAFVCAIVGVVLIVSLVTIVQSRQEYSTKESKIEPTIKHFIEIINNVDKAEYKTQYWELLSQTSKSKLIQQTGSLESAQREVWIMLQGIVESQRHVEFLAIEYTEIRGNIATVLIKVKITEGDQEPVEITQLHRYRWEDGEWKFIDWNIEKEMYRE